ncbi:MAG TPA: type II toxin-antitoxin system VapC family toxin [Microthrixaceae bacterium]|nr:type II toxin-antitoxin system VapC family toxin [Microthrixaceae bacterium]
MIAYFDTSAVVPLIIDESSSELCNRIWDESSRVVSARLLYPEARAALARAERMGRITQRQLRLAVVELESVVAEIDHVELTEAVARAAGELAETQGLRGYDAVHLASAESVADSDLVLIAADSDLVEAAAAIGLAVSNTKV